jgi:hypothetical protein
MGTCGSDYDVVEVDVVIFNSVTEFWSEHDPAAKVGMAKLTEEEKKALGFI